MIIYGFMRSSKRIKSNLTAVLPLFGNYVAESYRSAMEVLKSIGAKVFGSVCEYTYVFSNQSNEINVYSR